MRHLLHIWLEYPCKLMSDPHNNQPTLPHPSLLPIWEGQIYQTALVLGTDYSQHMEAEIILHFPDNILGLRYILLNENFYTMWCQYNAVNFLQNPQSRQWASYGVSFVSTNSDLGNVLVTAVLYRIPYYTGPCYNGTCLYFFRISQKFVPEAPVDKCVTIGPGSGLRQNRWQPLLTWTNDDPDLTIPYGITRPHWVKVAFSKLHSVHIQKVMLTTTISLHILLVCWKELWNATLILFINDIALSQLMPLFLFSFLTFRHLMALLHLGGVPIRYFMVLPVLPEWPHTLVSLSPNMVGCLLWFGPHGPNNWKGNNDFLPEPTRDNISWFNSFSSGEGWSYIDIGHCWFR